MIPPTNRPVRHEAGHTWWAVRYSRLGPSTAWVSDGAPAPTSHADALRRVAAAPRIVYVLGKGEGRRYQPSHGDTTHALLRDACAAEVARSCPPTLTPDDPPTEPGLVVTLPEPAPLPELEPPARYPLAPALVVAVALPVVALVLLAMGVL